MQLDTTIEAIINKIEKAFVKEFGKEINQEDLFHIINSQFVSVVHAMKSEQTIKLDKLGKFLQKEGRVKALKSRNLNK
jgi:nucleoid DNA-binding protein